MYRLQGLVESGVISQSQLIHNFAGRVVSGTLSWAGATVGMKCYLRDGRDASAPVIATFIMSTANGSIPLSWTYGKEFRTALFFDEGDLVSPAANVFIELTYKPYVGSVDRKAQYYVEFDSVNSGIKVADPRKSINAYDPDTVDSPFTIAMDVYMRSAGEGSLGTLCYKDESSGPTVASAGYKLHVFSLGSGYAKLGFNVRHGDGKDATRLTVSCGVTAQSNGVPQNQWARVLAVYYGSQNSGWQNLPHGGNCYANGVQLINGDQPPGTANGVSFPVDSLRDDRDIPLYIGNRWDGSVTWDGFIRSFEFWHGYAFTPTDALNDYNGIVIPGKTSSFRFLEGQGTKVADVLGGNVGLIGKITGANTFVEDASKAKWGKYSDLPLVAGV